MSCCTTSDSSIIGGTLLFQNPKSFLHSSSLQEKEEQLFSGPKEDSRVSEATRRAVQEEEEG